MPVLLWLYAWDSNLQAFSEVVDIQNLLPLWFLSHLINIKLMFQGLPPFCGSKCLWNLQQYFIMKSSFKCGWNCQLIKTVREKEIMNKPERDRLTEHSLFKRNCFHCNSHLHLLELLKFFHFLFHILCHSDFSVSEQPSAGPESAIAAPPVHIEANQQYYSTIYKLGDVCIISCLLQLSLL